MRISLLLLVLTAALAAGCRGSRLATDPLMRSGAFLTRHKTDAGVASDVSPTAPSSLASFEAKVLAIRKEWEKKLSSPSAVVAEDLGTSIDPAVLAAVREDNFVSSLAEQVTLERMLAGAYVRNPTLKAARHKLTGTLEQFAQVTYLDNVLRQYASFTRSSITRLRPTLPMDTVAKRFPFPGSLELKAAIVSHSVMEAQAKYESVLRTVIANTRLIYADYVYVVRAQAITAETVRYLEQLEQTARGKLSAGTAGKSNVVQIQVQLSQFENDLITLAWDKDTLRARLNALLGLPSTSQLADPVPAALPARATSRVDLQALAVAEQPDILGARARALRMAAMIELAEQGTYPELSAGLSTFEDVSHATGGSRKDREPFTTRPKVNPDPFFGSKEAYLSESREAERAARFLVQAAEDETAARVTTALNEFDTAWRLRDLYQDVQLAQARQAYEDAFSAYGVDRAEFMSVIDSLRQWLRFRLDADGADRDIHKAFARLERAVGIPLGTGD